MTAASPPDGPDPRAALVVRVRTKTHEVDAYLTDVGRRRRRLTNVTIIGGAAAAALTAAPALGGTSFSDWLETTFGLSSPAWQILCALAALCSLGATVATQLLKANHYDENVVRAQGVRASLEGLEVGLASGTVDAADGTARFLQTIENASFVQPRDRS